MKIALVKEGFELVNAEADVNQKVRAAANCFQRLGAEVHEVSIPMHPLGAAIWVPIGVEGLTQTMMWGDGYGLSRPDLYVTSLMDFHRSWRTRANELSETTKLFTLLGTYINRHHGSRYYGKAMNICRLLTAAYDAVLAKFDLLMMPTTPIKASKLPAPTATKEEYVDKALNMIGNTSPFDITHHPAMAIPCGMSDGLPVSLMLVGKHFDEPTIYRAAFAFERSADWKTL
jgi:amidase